MKCPGGKKCSDIPPPYQNIFCILQKKAKNRISYSLVFIFTVSSPLLSEKHLAAEESEKKQEIERNESCLDFPCGHSAHCQVFPWTDRPIQ